MTNDLKLRWLSLLMGAWAREESLPDCPACKAIMEKAVVMKDGAAIKPLRDLPAEGGTQ